MNSDPSRWFSLLTAGGTLSAARPLSKTVKTLQGFPYSCDSVRNKTAHAAKQSRFDLACLDGDGKLPDKCRGRLYFPPGANLSSATILMGPQSLSSIWMAAVHLPDSALLLCADVGSCFWLVFGCPVHDKCGFNLEYFNRNYYLIT